MSKKNNNETQDTYTIRRLTKEFGITSRAIRFYEVKGLLSPTRRGITRIFSKRDRARLKLILRGKQVGFPLNEIKQMLDLYDQDGGDVAQRKVALAKSRRQLTLLHQQRAELDDAIVELEKLCNELAVAEGDNDNGVVDSSGQPDTKRCQ